MREFYGILRNFSKICLPPQNPTIQRSNLKNQDRSEYSKFIKSSHYVINSLCKIHIKFEIKNYVNPSTCTTSEYKIKIFQTYGYYLS